MTRSAALSPPSPAVPSRRATRPWRLWRRFAGALRRGLRRLGLGPWIAEDARYLAAAHSLEDLERRQRRLERHGSPLPPAWLP